MKNAKNVENFIRSIFEVYGLNYGEYFSAFTADDEKVELPMVIDGALDMAMVSRAAEILGEDVEDLLTLNRKRPRSGRSNFLISSISRLLRMLATEPITEMIMIPFV